MNSLIDFIEENKKNLIYISIFLLILLGTYFFMFSSKNEPQPTESIAVEKIKKVEVEFIEIEEEFPKFVEDKATEKILMIQSEVNQELSILSSANVGGYNVALIGQYDTKDLNKTDYLNCVLELREAKLQFELPVDTIMLRNIDELYLKVTKSDNHFVMENAYILKELNKEMNYSVKLILYDDYVAISLIELGIKNQGNLDTNKTKLSQFMLSKITDIELQEEHTDIGIDKSFTIESLKKPVISDLIKDKLIKAERVYF